MGVTPNFIPNVLLVIYCDCSHKMSDHANIKENALFKTQWLLLALTWGSSLKGKQLHHLELMRLAIKLFGILSISKFTYLRLTSY